MPHVDTPQSRLQAGLAQGDITPPVGIYHRMWGAATHDRAAGVHRPLTATALWLAAHHAADPLREGRLLAALDHCILERTEVERIRAAVTTRTRIPTERIHVALSHTHAAGLMSRSRADQPGGELIAPYLDDLADRVARLAEQALAAARPATIVYGHGRCNLAANRDYWDAQSEQFVCGLNPGGSADDTVLVARIAGADGSDIGVIVNYACHPTTLAFENQAISPDYVGALRETITSATGAPCLFLQGASGDLGPRLGFVGDPAVADRNGRQLGYAALSALEGLAPRGTRCVYKGPVLSGATLGIWEHQSAPAADLQRHTAWSEAQWTAPFNYRPGLPTVGGLRDEQARWQAEEDAANRAGDAARARDCRAKVERARRWLRRVETLPPGQTYPYPITLWRLGDAIWLILPGEHYQWLQRELRSRFPHHAIVVVTVADDWLPGYVPTAATYGYGIYQESIALVAPGSAEVLVEEISRRVRQLG